MKFHLFVVCLGTLDPKSTNLFSLKEELLAIHLMICHLLGDVDFEILNGCLCAGGLAIADCRLSSNGFDCDP